MDNITIKYNTARLIAMHNLIREIDDENAYAEWTVDLALPDEPNEGDFEFIANDEEMYQDCVKIFKRIINEYL